MASKRSAAASVDCGNLLVSFIRQSSAGTALAASANSAFAQVDLIGLSGPPRIALNISGLMELKQSGAGSVVHIDLLTDSLKEQRLGTVYAIDAKSATRQCTPRGISRGTGAWSTGKLTVLKESIAEAAAGGFRSLALENANPLGTGYPLGVGTARANGGQRTEGK